MSSDSITGQINSPSLTTTSTTSAAAMEDPTIDPKEAVASTSTYTTTPASPPPRSPSPNKCSICLGELFNKCYTNSCCHQFCFGCLLEWSKIKAECPLCKSSFRSIYHNIRSMSDYDEYHVPLNTIPHLSIRLTTSDPYAQILGADIDLRRHELDHGYSSPLSPRYIRERFERIRDRDPRVIRILEVGPVSERRAFDAYMNSASSLSLDNPFYSEQAEYFGSYHDGTTATAGSNPATIRGYQNRRRIYDRCHWVLPFHSTLQPGTVFFPSVEYFRTHPSAFGRINTWLYREVTVLLGLSRTRTEMGFVYDLILGLLLRYDIRSREFREMVKLYFGARVKHFQHEFYHFVLSGMRAEGYDRVATYPSTTSSGAGASQSRYSGPPPVVTIGDSDDEAIDDDEIVVIDDEVLDTTQSVSLPLVEGRERVSVNIAVRPIRPPPPCMGSSTFELDDANPDSVHSDTEWAFDLAHDPIMPVLENQQDSNVDSGTSDYRARPTESSRRSTVSRRNRERIRVSSPNRVGRSQSRCNDDPTDLIGTLTRQWRLPEQDRPLTEDDFPILNLRSKVPSSRAESDHRSTTVAELTAQTVTTNGFIEELRPPVPHPITQHESLREANALLAEGMNSTCERYPLRSRGGHDTVDTSMTTLQLIYRNLDSAPVSSSSAMNSPSFYNLELPTDTRSGKKRPDRRTRNTQLISTLTGESSRDESHTDAHHCRDSTRNLEASCSLIGGSRSGVRISLPHQRNTDPGRLTTSTRTSTCTLLDSYLDRPIEPKVEKKCKKSKLNTNTQNQDDEDCLFVGIHPVVKKPPLAVITISSEDEETVESSRRLKAERREQHVFNHEFDEFLSWSNSQRSGSREENSPVNLLDGLRNVTASFDAVVGNDAAFPEVTRSGAPSRRTTNSQEAMSCPSTSTASTSRTKKTDSKKRKSRSKCKTQPKKTKSAKRREPVSKQIVSSSSSSSSSDSEDGLGENPKQSKKERIKPIRTKGKPKRFITKKKKTVPSSRTGTRKRNITPSSKSYKKGIPKSKRFKRLLRDSSSDSSTTSNESNKARIGRKYLTTSSESEDEVDIRIRQASCTSSSEHSHPPRYSPNSSLSSSSSSLPVDLRTTTGARFNVSNFQIERRWESNDGDDSVVQQTVFAENLSISDSTDSNSVGFTGQDPPSPFSNSQLDNENTGQASWSSIISAAPSPNFELLQSSSSTTSKSSSIQTEDEAGLNARDLGELNSSYNERRHSSLQSIIGSYNPSSSGAMSNYSSLTTDLNPTNSTTGLDLRLNSTIESWRQYLRPTTNSLEESTNSMAALDGYWCSSNDWMA